MGVVKLSTAGILDYQKYSSFLAGNAAFSPSAYDLLETEILTGTTASVTFSSLNSTYGAAGYQHLQMRAVLRSDYASVERTIIIKINSATTSLRGHGLYGAGSSVLSFNYSSLQLGSYPGSSATSDAFGAAIVDILDPFSANKNTTIKVLNGNTTTPWIALQSGAWFDTTAVDSLEVVPLSANLVTGTRISLYGLKAA